MIAIHHLIRYILHVALPHCIRKICPFHLPFFRLLNVATKHSLLPSSTILPCLPPIDIPPIDHPPIDIPPINIPPSRLALFTDTPI